MLSTLLSQIQTQLSSKRFWLASVFPLLLFILASGWILYRQYPGWKSWLASFEGLKEQAILYSAVVAVLLALAYIFSAMNSTLLEWLEGKRGIALLLIPWLYWHQRAKLQRIKQEYKDAAFNVINIQKNLNAWMQELADARAVGVRQNTCNARWPKTEQGKAVNRVLRKARHGGYIPNEDLKASVAALRELLAFNSAVKTDDEGSKKLNAAYSAFKEAILYARDRSQFNRVHLYNKRQFGYPGSFDGNELSEAQPHNVLALTTMGNIGQTIRSYAITRYNLDLDIFWSRLQNSIQGNTNYFGVLQDVKVQVDCLVALVWLSAVFSLIFTPWMFFRGASLEFVAAGAAGFLSLWLYSLACSSYAVFADVMRSAVDLFRFKLLDDLHLGLPVRPEEESFLWERLGDITGYARKEIIQYKHPGK